MRDSKGSSGSLGSGFVSVAGAAMRKTEGRVMFQSEIEESRRVL